MDSLEELLTNKNIYYKISGADYVINCLNPEHEDSNPSMRIDKLTGVFNCLSCGYSGNIYKLFDVYINTIDIKCKQLKDKIKNIMSTNLNIPLGSEPFQKEYRGISAETYKFFNCFTHPNFEGRLVFPITDIAGNIKVFQARYIYSDLEPKYIFEPKHSTIPLFPANPKLINGSIILVEGMFDLLNLYDKGLTNVICTFGTAFGSVKNYKKIEKNIEKLNIYKVQGVHTLYILYDADKAGISAAKNLERNLKDKYIIYIIDLETGTDPGSLTHEEVHNLRNMLYS